MFKKLRTSLAVKYQERKREKNFELQMEQFAGADVNKRFSLKKEDLYPRLDDATETTWFDSHYIYHPAWAVRVVRKIAPEKHIDISSTLAFCSALSAFIPTEFYDFRPAKLVLPGLICGQADLTRLFFETGSLKSLSCMHTVEHVGLGRYGDPIDPEGDIQAMNELKRVLAPGGDLLFVTPVGRPRIQFNAHRIYSYEMIRKQFGELELKEFSLVTDAGDLVMNADPGLVAAQAYGCGCFWFKKSK